jgi:hypothetical protein
MRLRLLPALSLLIAFAIGAAQTTAAPKRAADAAARTSFSLSASAYGTLVKEGNNFRSGPTAPSGIGCTNDTGVQDSNTVSSVSVENFLSTGAVDTTAETLAVSDGVGARATSDVHAANLLQGLITADEVTAVSEVSHDSSGFHADASGSSFVNLVVAGQPIGATPDPNTRIDLQGIGYVILNEQHKRVRSDTASLVVNMIHVVVTQDNSIGVPIGTNIIVAHAQSKISGPFAGLLDGSAYGTQVTVNGGGGGDIESGPSALVNLGCEGTNGQTKFNRIAGVRIAGVLRTGTITTTAVGTVTASGADGETTARVERVNLLSALVRAGTVKADAHASTNGTDFSFSDAGSKFVGLAVAGHPEINDDVPPNTEVAIAGLGTLYLHRVLQNAHRIQVRMIELVVTQDNDFNLPIGTDVQIGVAEASAH